MTNPFIIRVRGWHKNTCVNHPTFVSHLRIMCHRRTLATCFCVGRLFLHVSQ